MPEPVEISHATPEIAPAASEMNVASSKPQEEINLPSAAVESQSNLQKINLSLACTAAFS